MVLGPPLLPCPGSTAKVAGAPHSRCGSAGCRLLPAVGLSFLGASYRSCSLEHPATSSTPCLLLSDLDFPTPPPPNSSAPPTFAGGGRPGDGRVASDQQANIMMVRPQTAHVFCLGNYVGFGAGKAIPGNVISTGTNRFSAVLRGTAISVKCN